MPETMIGRVLKDTYRIYERVGSGGFAAPADLASRAQSANQPGRGCQGPKTRVYCGTSLCRAVPPGGGPGPPVPASQRRANAGLWPGGRRAFPGHGVPGGQEPVRGPPGTGDPVGGPGAVYGPAWAGPCRPPPRPALSIATSSRATSWCCLRRQRVRATWSRSWTLASPRWPAWLG